MALNSKEDWKNGAKLIGAGLAVSALFPPIAVVGGLLALGGGIAIIHDDEDPEVTRERSSRGGRGR